MAQTSAFILVPGDRASRVCVDLRQASFTLPSTPSVVHPPHLDGLPDERNPVENYSKSIKSFEPIDEQYIDRLLAMYAANDAITRVGLLTEYFPTPSALPNDFKCFAEFFAENQGLPMLIGWLDNAIENDDIKLQGAVIESLTRLLGVLSVDRPRPCALAARSALDRLKILLIEIGTCGEISVAERAWHLVREVVRLPSLPPAPSLPAPVLPPPILVAKCESSLSPVDTHIGSPVPSSSSLLSPKPSSNESMTSGNSPGFASPNASSTHEDAWAVSPSSILATVSSDHLPLPIPSDQGDLPTLASFSVEDEEMKSTDVSAPSPALLLPVSTEDPSSIPVSVPSSAGPALPLVEPKSIPAALNTRPAFQPKFSSKPKAKSKARSAQPNRKRTLAVSSEAEPQAKNASAEKNGEQHPGEKRQKTRPTVNTESETSNLEPSVDVSAAPLPGGRFVTVDGVPALALGVRKAINPSAVRGSAPICRSPGPEEKDAPVVPKIPKRPAASKEVSAPPKIPKRPAESVEPEQRPAEKRRMVAKPVDSVKDISQEKELVVYQSSEPKLQTKKADSQPIQPKTKPKNATQEEQSPKIETKVANNQEQLSKIQAATRQAKEAAKNSVAQLQATSTANDEAHFATANADVAPTTQARTNKIPKKKRQTKFLPADPNLYVRFPPANPDPRDQPPLKEPTPSAFSGPTFQQVPPFRRNSPFSPRNEFARANGRGRVKGKDKGKDRTPVPPVKAVTSLTVRSDRPSDPSHQAQPANSDETKTLVLFRGSFESALEAVGKALSAGGVIQLPLDYRGLSARALFDSIRASLPLDSVPCFVSTGDFCGFIAYPSRLQCDLVVDALQHMTLIGSPRRLVASQLTFEQFVAAHRTNFKSFQFWGPWAHEGRLSDQARNVPDPERSKGALEARLARENQLRMNALPLSLLSRDARVAVIRACRHVTNCKGPCCSRSIPEVDEVAGLKLKLRVDTFLKLNRVVMPELSRLAEPKNVVVPLAQ